MSVDFEPGDRVVDPLDGHLRKVINVAGDSVFFEDGGVMGLLECKDVLLPSEAESYEMEDVQ